MKVIQGTQFMEEQRTELPANTNLSQKYAATGKHSFTSLAGYLFDAKTNHNTEERQSESQREKDGDRERTPEVKHSLTTTNWLSPTNSCVFYVLFIPLATEYKQLSVICATLMNRSISSAKSETCGHRRRHRGFVNRRGCLGTVPAAARCRSSKGHRGWRGRVTVGDAGRSEGLREAERDGYKRNDFPPPLSTLTGTLLTCRAVHAFLFSMAEAGAK